ncbi:gag-polypeptide of LTR copia-type domain-containing protein [Phthorimaea operculella]|nr:gag-polypeptide of LTR copia-type domain-containing protein [Phthorimaea operculella]
MESRSLGTAVVWAVKYGLLERPYSKSFYVRNLSFFCGRCSVEMSSVVAESGTACFIVFYEENKRLKTSDLRLQIKPFCGEDFATWKFRLCSMLREYNCIQAILNVVFASVPENKRNEAKAQSIIMAAIADNSHIDFIQNENTAYSMLNKLEGIFMKKSTRSKLVLRLTQRRLIANGTFATTYKYIQPVEGCWKQLI